MKLQLISRHRAALMGIGTIMILICHSAARISMPNIILYPLSYLNIGVDIFLFLSGMGLFYSLEKHAKSTKTMFFWYTKRFIRICVPYVLIVLPFCGLSMYIEGESISSILYFFSTLAFWTDHTGFWFISLLIPLYILSPLLYNFIKNNALVKSIGLSAFCIIVSLLPIFDTCTYSDIFQNIQFTLVRIPSFILGMYFAPFILKDKDINMSIFLILIVIGLVFLAITKRLVYTYTFMVLPILVLCVVCLDKFRLNKVYKGCSFLGRVSLESYLFNGAIQIYIIWIVSLLGIKDYNNIIMYSMVIIVGIVLSILFNEVSNKICNSLNGYLTTA